MYSHSTLHLLTLNPWPLTLLTLLLPQPLSSTAVYVTLSTLSKTGGLSARPWSLITKLGEDLRPRGNKVISCCWVLVFLIFIFFYREKHIKVEGKSIENVPGCNALIWPVEGADGLIWLIPLNRTVELWVCTHSALYPLWETVSDHVVSMLVIFYLVSISLILEDYGSWGENVREHSGRVRLC